MNPVISYIANLHPLSFMGYYVLSTTVIYILLNIIIAKTRPAGNTTAVPAPYSISPSLSPSSILLKIFSSAPISSMPNAK